MLSYYNLDHNSYVPTPKKCGPQLERNFYHATQLVATHILKCFWVRTDDCACCGQLCDHCTQQCPTIE